MFKKDIESRLSLLRYGMLLVVVLAFAIPAATFGVFLGGQVSLMGAITPALISAVITGVVMVAVYFGYATILKRNMKEGGES